jgi:hypothetical protein
MQRKAWLKLVMVLTGPDLGWAALVALMASPDALGAEAKNENCAEANGLASASNKTTMTLRNGDALKERTMCNPEFSPRQIMTAAI